MFVGEVQFYNSTTYIGAHETFWQGGVDLLPTDPLKSERGQSINFSVYYQFGPLLGGID